MNKVCVIGNLNADLVLYPLQDFPTWGTEVLVTSMDWRPGGIANALLCLKRLGVEAPGLGNVGHDAVGQELLSTLAKQGIDTSYIESSNSRTALSVGLTRGDGERVFVTHLGHLPLLDLDLVLRQGAAWREARYVLISGYFLLPGLGFEGAKALIDEVHEKGKQVVLDTGWDISGWPERTKREVFGLLQDVDVFLPSLNEAQALTGECTPEACLASLFRSCPNCVIMKLGEAGCMARTKEGTFRQPAFPVQALDTTGAGDSFNAGVLLGLLRGWDIRETLRFANAVAALVISRPRDVGYPTLSEVEEFLCKGGTS